MNNSALTWDGDWVWSLPLIVINVVVHVSGLDFINRAVLRVIKRVRHHRNFTALFGLAFVHNIVAGPTCIVRLRTAVQTHRVALLERIRYFRRGIATIEPLIRAAQLAEQPRREP